MAVLTTTPTPAVILAPLHLLFFSALLGAELYQSFLVTKICFSALPRPSFVSLQQRLFPAYFRAQSLLLLLAAATVPPSGPSSLAAKKGAWIPLAVAGAAALLNLVLYGPRTKQLMIERAHQETGDSRTKPSGDSGEAETNSSETQRLKRSFSRNHAMSIHLNLVSIGATLWWGWNLASKLDFKTE
ncbi:hypothetical protein F5X99DRAFT_410356 [Biscogniauxia marginata]|nr:hypothetical protein F5X99DRAFT_410356 [Biscogniauxia marginata]